VVHSNYLSKDEDYMERLWLLNPQLHIHVIYYRAYSF